MLLGKVKTDGIVVQEIVADKDSSVNATFCRHFPEGMLTLQPLYKNPTQKFGSNKKEQM